MYEMLVGIPPWYSENRQELYDGIVKKPLVFPTEPVLSSEAYSLITSLLSKDPIKRPNAITIRIHSFFASVDWEMVEARKLPVPWLPPTNDLDCFDPSFTEENVSNSIPKSLSFSFHQMSVGNDFSGFSWTRDKSLVAPPHLYDDDDL